MLLLLLLFISSCNSTLEQARKLDNMLNSKGAGIDAVLDFDVPDSLLVSVASCLK
jgi:adenylate kinase family enzyme